MTGAELYANLETIRLQAGELTGEIVVAAAAAPTHPLHGRYFSKSEKQLAHERRIDLANDDIRSLTLEFIDGTGAPQKVRRYLSVETVQGQMAYQPTDEIAQNPVLAALALQSAEREWRTLMARYGHLKEFVEMVQQSLPAQAA
jgi:hypothetical protein